MNNLANDTSSGVTLEILNGMLRANGLIVVDHDANPEPYEEIYDVVEHELSKKPDEPTPIVLANIVNDATIKTILYNEDKTGLVLKEEASNRGQKRIGRRDRMNLSQFIEAGWGICYHQSLAVGAVFNLLQDRRGVEGAISLDRSRPIRRRREAHSWIRYTVDEDVIIIDSAAVAGAFKLGTSLSF